MKFEKLHITGFGCLQDTVIDGLSPGLNIIEGENEAGKTTTLEFVRALLFGFRRKGSGSQYLPPEGVSHGGWALARSRADVQWRIERTPGTGGGRCSVKNVVNGESGDITTVVGRAERNQFEKIFAFSLDELSTLSKDDERVFEHIYAASGGSKGRSLNAVSAELEKSLQELYKKGGQNPEINQRLSRLRELKGFAEEQSGQLQQWNEAQDRLAQRRQTRDEMREKSDLAEREWKAVSSQKKAWPAWVDLVAAREMLAQLPETNALPANAMSQLTELQKRCRNLREILSENESEAGRIREKIERLEIDENLLQQAKAILALEQRIGDFSNAQQEERNAQRDLRDKQIDLEERLRVVGGWNAEQLQQADFETLQAGAQRLSESLKTADSALKDETLLHQNAAETHERLKANQAELQNQFQEQRKNIARTDPECQALEVALGDLKILQAQTKKSIVGCEREEAEFEAAFPATTPTSEALEAQQKSLDELTELCAAREAATGQIEQQRAAIEELKTRADAAPQTESASKIPPWAAFIPLLLGAFCAALFWQQLVVVIIIVTLSLLVSGVLLWLAMRSPNVAAAPVDISAAFAKLEAMEAAQKQRENSIAAIASTHKWNCADSAALRALRRQLQAAFASRAAQDAARVQLEKLRRQVSDDKNESNSALKNLQSEFGIAVSSASEMRDAQQKLQGEREAHRQLETTKQALLTLQKDVAAAEQKTHTCAERAAQVGSTLEQEKEKWRQWLQVAELPETVTPERAASALQNAIGAKSVLRDIKNLEHKQADYRKKIKAFTDSAAAIFGQLQRALPGGDELVAGMRQLAQSVKLHAERHADRVRLQDAQTGLRDATEQTQRNLKTGENEIAELLKTAHATDETHLTELAAADERRRELEKEIQGHENTLASHSAPGDACQKLQENLSELDNATLAERLEIAQQNHEELQKQNEDAIRELGEAENEIKNLELHAANLTATQRQQQQCEAEISGLAERWAVDQFALQLVERTRRSFEENRQPAILQRTGLAMKKISGERYQGVLGTEGLAAIRLNEGEGAAKEIEMWSRGTREQFYLALRLAFIEDYCQSANTEPLPVVMDDVLVHSDGYSRLRAASELIGEFAQNHQVLYFTCRPDDAEILFRAAPIANHYRLQNGAFHLKQSA